MILVSLLFLQFVVFGSFEEGYHKGFGIPAALRIKTREVAYLSRNNNNNDNNVVNANYPYYAGLLIQFSDANEFSCCGASLLSAVRLVTAAHCWDDGYMLPTKFEVVLGSHFLTTGGLRIETKEVQPHTHFDFKTSNVSHNDIAMIFLPNSIDFNDRIAPIRLPPQELDSESSLFGLWGNFTGLGLTEIDLERTDPIGTSLRTVSLKIMTNEECRKQIPDLTDLQFCTEVDQEMGPCYGDNGGPLVLHDTEGDFKYLAGIISTGLRGMKCGYAPTVYTSVSMYMEFIEHTKRGSH